MRRRWIILALVLLWMHPVEAGRVTALPGLADNPPLQQYLKSLDGEFRDSLNRTYLIFCPSTLSTTMTCEQARPRFTDACTIMRVDGVVTTAPSGSSIIVDVNECTDAATCTSIWSSNQANRLTISAGATSANTTTFDTTASRYMEQGHLLSMDLDQASSGSNLTLMVTCRLGTVTP